MRGEAGAPLHPGPQNGNSTDTTVPGVTKEQQQEDVGLGKLRFGVKVCCLKCWQGMMQQEESDVTDMTVIITSLGRSVTPRRHNVTKTKSGSHTGNQKRAWALTLRHLLTSGLRNNPGRMAVFKLLL